MVTLLTKTCSLTFTAYQGEIHKKLAAEFMSYDLTAGLPLPKKNFEDKKSRTSKTVATFYTLFPLCYSILFPFSRVFKFRKTNL